MFNKAILLTTKGSASYDMEYEVTFGSSGYIIGYYPGLCGSSVTKNGDVDLYVLYKSTSSEAMIAFADSEGNAIALDTDAIKVVNLTSGGAQFAFKGGGVGYVIQGDEPFVGCVSGETYNFGVLKIDIS